MLINRALLSTKLAALALFCHSFMLERPFVDADSSGSLTSTHFGVPGYNLTFDFVIVGGGTAGLTIAQRLAANGTFSVAIIEAGDFPELGGNATQIPAANTVPITEFNPLLDWALSSSAAPDLNDRRVTLAAGKALGGSSTRNDMWYHQSCTDAFDVWANMTGDESYRFTNFRNFLLRSAKYYPAPKGGGSSSEPIPDASSSFDANGGPLQVGYSAWANPISRFVGQAMTAAGLTQIDISSGTLLGWGWVPLTVTPGMVRSSSQSSFLSESLKENLPLTVYRNTLAQRILFDSNTAATGVNVVTGPIRYNLSARREVIVSGGVFHSPQILMVSGIGPRKILEAHDIPIVSDRPGVGSGLQDHPLISISHKVNVLTHSVLSDPEYYQRAITEFQQNRTGMLTNPGGDITGFLKFNRSIFSEDLQTHLSQFPKGWPDVNFEFPDTYVGLGAPNQGSNYVAASAALNSPCSRGNVSITSADIADPPIINLNWLQDARDQQLAIASFKATRDLFAQSAMRPVLLGAEAFPGSNYTTDAAILDVIRQSILSSNHGSCTCAMGRKEDTMAVIDNEAKVIGVNRLRVVDASAFPILPPGHPMSVVYGLAEKISASILADV